MSRPVTLAGGRGIPLPDRDCDIQGALNLTRYRNIHTDVI